MMEGKGMSAMAPTCVEETDLGTAQIVEALEGRASFYDFIASLYYLPLKVEQIENIASMDLSAYRGMDPLLDEGLEDMVRSLRRRNTGTRQELAVDFTATFAGTSSWKGEYAVPYESVFTSDEGLMRDGRDRAGHSCSCSIASRSS